MGPEAEWERVERRNREAMRRGAGLPKGGHRFVPSRYIPDWCQVCHQRKADH